MRKRGKWILNGRLIDLVGETAGRALAAIDAKLWSFRPDRAWDVFVLAEKPADGPQAGTDAR